MTLEEYHLQAKKPRKQIEGQHQTQLGQWLNKYFALKPNPDLIFWTYSGAGERKPLKTGVLQKRKGLQRGDFDYRFELKDGDNMRLVYLETKTTKGSLTPEQKAFKAKHKNISNATCYVSQEFEESIRILEKEGIVR